MNIPIPTTQHYQIHRFCQRPLKSINTIVEFQNKTSQILNPCVPFPVSMFQPLPLYLEATIALSLGLRV